MSMLFKRIKDWATSITAFRTGDVIPVDGPSGTAKMSKDNLLRETAEYNHTAEIIDAISTEATYDDVIPYRNINNDGSVQELDETNPDNQWQVVTDYIPCTKDSVISEIQYCDISTNTKWGIAFYDAGKNFIVGYKAVNTGGTNVIYNFYKSNTIPTIPSNAAYLVLASNNSDVVDVQPYVTFKVLDNVISISKDYTDKSIDGLEYVRDVPVVIVPNLPNTRIRNTGATASQDGTWSSDFIDLGIGEVDAICWGDIEAASTTVGIAFYDKDKTYISGYKAASVTPHSQPSTGIWQSTKMPSVPANAKYFRFSGKPDVKVYPFVRFLAKGVDKFPALKDKKILVFGDSISDTIVSLGGPERYPEYIKKMTDCVIVPYAVSASGFGQDGNNPTYGSVDNKVWQQIELAHTNEETCDLIIVAAGTNDWDFGTPLGQFSDIELADMATPSFYFLVEKAIKKLEACFPTQRCLFITPLPRNQERSGNWVDQHTTFAWQPNPLTDYAKAIKEVCAWHSIPVLDMMTDSNMRLESAEARLLWTEDGLHPTNYYAATVYAPMVIRELTRCLTPYYAQV